MKLICVNPNKTLTQGAIYDGKLVRKMRKTFGGTFYEVFKYEKEIFKNADLILLNGKYYSAARFVPYAGNTHLIIKDNPVPSLTKYQRELLIDTVQKAYEPSLLCEKEEYSWALTKEHKKKTANLKKILEKLQNGVETEKN